MAITVALHSSNVRFADLVLVGQTSTTIDLSVTILPGSRLQLGTIIFDGLLPGTSYTLTIDLLNSSGAIITHATTELCDPAGVGEDADDPIPQPVWVPAGFSTSSDDDGLSFAQGSQIPRTSSHFATVVADELSDERDFLNFSDGLVDPAETFDESWGLRILDGVEQPFLAVFRFNIFALEEGLPIDETIPSCCDKAPPGGTTPGSLPPPNPFIPLPPWTSVGCEGLGTYLTAGNPTEVESWEL